MSGYILPSHRGACTVCGKVVQISRTSAEKPKCLECRRANPAPRKNGRPGPKSSRKCRDCGRVFVRENGNICNTCTSKRYRARHGRKQYAKSKVCEWCGVVFTTTVSATKACCATHGLWLLHHGMPSQSKELVAVPREPNRRVPLVKTPAPVARWWRVIVQGRCAWCGEMFTAPSTTVAAYCSKRCYRSAAKMARGERFIVEPGRRFRLYERDGWMCGICGEATSREWTSGDPWSPTLDHIEPQAATLLPDHSDGNLRTAHALCNSIRSDGALTDAEVRALVAERRRVARDVVV